MRDIETAKERCSRIFQALGCGAPEWQPSADDRGTLVCYAEGQYTTRDMDDDNEPVTYPVLALVFAPYIMGGKPRAAAYWEVLTDCPGDPFDALASGGSITLGADMVGEVKPLERTVCDWCGKVWLVTWRSDFWDHVRLKFSGHNAWRTGYINAPTPGGINTDKRMDAEQARAYAEGALPHIGDALREAADLLDVWVTEGALPPAEGS